jgi:hypothetical protein
MNPKALVGMAVTESLCLYDMLVGDGGVTKVKSVWLCSTMLVTVLHPEVIYDDHRTDSRLPGHAEPHAVTYLQLQISALMSNAPPN